MKGRLTKSVSYLLQDDSAEDEPREDEDFVARRRVILTIKEEVSSQWSFMSGNNCSHHTLESIVEHDGPTGHQHQWNGGDLPTCELHVLVCP